MKTEIEKVNLKSEPDENGTWYRWKETCDSCGVTIRGHEYISSSKPNADEKDYCIKCLQKLIGFT